MKSIPLRTCIGCKEKKNKKELLRIVKNNEQEIFVDITGKKDGRGAYVCKNISCVLSAIKTKALERKLECKISEEKYQEIREEIEKQIEG